MPPSPSTPGKGPVSRLVRFFGAFPMLCVLLGAQVLCLGGMVAAATLPALRASPIFERVLCALMLLLAAAYFVMFMVYAARAHRNYKKAVADFERNRLF